MRRAGIVTALAVALNAVVVATIVAELVLRFFVALPLARILPEVRYARHPVRGFTLVPGQVAYTYGAEATIDHSGFRTNGPSTQRSEYAPTVLAVGDSFTFGLGVRDDETWPARLERRLAEWQPDVRVANAGTISYGVFQEMDLLANGLERVPRVVVHALYWNDFMSAAAPRQGDPPRVGDDGYFVWDGLSAPRSVLQRGKVWLGSHSALGYTLRRAFDRLHGPDLTSSYGKSYARFIANGLSESEWLPIEDFYRRLIHIGRERGFATVVVLLPVVDIVGTPQAERHPYAVAARGLLHRLNIPVVDGFALWPQGHRGRRLFLPQGSDAHLNAEGYRTIADAVAALILENPDLRARLAIPY